MTFTLARSLLRLVVAAAVLGVPARASAIDFMVAGEGGYFDMSAKKSAKAIFDGATGGFTGGGSASVSLVGPLFVAVGAHSFSRTGERVFVADATSPVFRLGHPLKMRTTPVYAMLGWGFMRKPKQRSRHRSNLDPYVALGAGVTSYREESDIAGLKETFTASKSSIHMALGADYRMSYARIGVEIMYTLVPNTIGTAGVSKVYGEKDVGGLTIVGRLGFGSR